MATSWGERGGVAVRVGEWWVQGRGGDGQALRPTAHAHSLLIVITFQHYMNPYPTPPHLRHARCLPNMKPIISYTPTTPSLTYATLAVSQTHHPIPSHLRHACRVVFDAVEAVAEIAISG